MKIENENLDDHHCSVIERKELKAEMAACDENPGTPEDRSQCQAQVKEASKKREFACKYS